MSEKGEVFQSGLADLLGRTKASTPHADLLRQLLDLRLPKTEREHAAVREIERLREELRQSSIDHTRAEVERLREALKKYGQHLSDCSLVLNGYQCTCGFNQQEPPR